MSLELTACLCAEGLGMKDGLPDLQKAMGLFYHAATIDKGDSYSIRYNVRPSFPAPLNPPVDADEAVPSVCG